MPDVSDSFSDRRSSAFAAASTTAASPRKTSAGLRGILASSSVQSIHSANKSVPNHASRYLRSGFELCQPQPLAFPGTTEGRSASFLSIHEVASTANNEF